MKGCFPLLIALLTLPVAAQFSTVFQVGAADNDASPFGREQYPAAQYPGDADGIDAFHYLSGVGGRTTDEPLENFERALTGGNPANHVVFPQASASPNGLLRVSTRLLWSGRSEQREPFHRIQLQVNGHTFHTSPQFRDYTTVTAEVKMSDLPPAARLKVGENIISIVRTSDSSSSSYIGVDYVRLELDPIAYQDLDGDQIPNFWEADYLLSDQNADDAAMDLDGDGLTNLEEYQLGTDPRLEDSDQDGLNDDQEGQSNPTLADTDNDGLLDGEETLSNPTLVDTDSDNSPDSQEVATGFDPSSSASTPPALHSIGINFVSAEQPSRGKWPEFQTNGLIPQTHWNHTRALRQWSVSDAADLYQDDTSDIISPTSGVIVDSSGSPTPVTLSFTYNGCWTNANAGTKAARLSNGYIASHRDAPASITLSNIPANRKYDLYVHTSSSGHQEDATLTVSGFDPVLHRPLTLGPNKQFLPIQEFSSDQSAPYANVLRFENVSAPDLQITLQEDRGSVGISAIQLVDRSADSDGDGLPDWWELQHRTGAKTANANADTDLDNLSLIQEFTAGSDPNSSDSDGDGLSDSEEVAAGTNPLKKDSDGDSLTDFDELGGDSPTNPLAVDSDGDLVSDAIEQRLGVDASDPNLSGLPTPTYGADGSLNWEITDVQIVWDHTAVPQVRNDPTRTLAMFYVFHENLSNWRPLQLGLVERHGALTYYLGVSENVFQDSNGRSVFRADWSGSLDRKNLAGFSGVGTHDISDPLTFRLSASPSGTRWTLTYAVLNQRTNIPLHSETISNLTAQPIVLNRDDAWRNDNGVIGLAGLATGNGSRVFRTQTALEVTSEFAPFADADNDGLPDSKEPVDPTDDVDGDGLNALEEHLAGTSDNASDSDGDLIDDRTEVLGFTNPSSSTSFPSFANTLPDLNRDLNNNGLPDLWEQRYGASQLSASADDDGDGLSNRQEAVAGTDPFDPQSAYKLTISATENDDVQLSAPSLPGTDQAIAQSSNLTSGWTPVPSSSTSGQLRAQMPTTSGSMFFRALVADKDTDSDGLTDAEELILGSSLTNANSVSRAHLHNSAAAPESEVSGDYAAFAERFSPVGNGRVSRREAARFLMQASFGPTLESIDHLASVGIDAWIDEQIDSVPATLHQPYLQTLSDDLAGPRVLKGYSFNRDGEFLNDSNIQSAFARAAIAGEDQLRQRVAWALSQIFVVSRRGGGLENKPVSLANYYDLFVKHAFGNFEDLLMDVTLHPCMGRYLSAVGNQPPAPELNRYPDENYAREVMQLFTIGLWELNPDGTRVLVNGQPVPTYSNEEITELARVMTGLWFGASRWGNGGYRDVDFILPMEMHPERHDFGEKTLLGGLVIPQREPSIENGLRDIRDAMNSLAHHHNTAPFISRALIQFLVTDNPKPSYVERVANVFSSTRGNLGEVVRAILTDPAARGAGPGDLEEDFGRLREPVIRTMHLARVLELDRHEDLKWWDYGNFSRVSAQSPLYSPSVFNFYRPDYTPPGLLKQRDLDAGVFEITNSYTAVSFPNELWDIATEGFRMYNTYHYPPSYRKLLLFVEDIDAILDYVNLVMTAGHINAETRASLRTSLEQASPTDRLQLAVYLASQSPHAAVQR